MVFTIPAHTFRRLGGSSHPDARGNLKNMISIFANQLFLVSVGFSRKRIPSVYGCLRRIDFLLYKTISVQFVGGYQGRVFYEPYKERSLASFASIPDALFIRDVRNLLMRVWERGNLPVVWAGLYRIFFFTG